MERRRAGGVSSNRNSASNEESQYWAQAVSAIEDFVALHTHPGASDQVLNINRLIADFPTDEQLEAGGGYKAIKPIKSKFVTGLEALRESAEKELAAIDLTLEHLEVLIALRDAPVPDTKRNKRLRLNSPALAPSSTPPVPRSSLGPGAGTGPPAHAHSNASGAGAVVVGKNANARNRQHQFVERLEPGRKVAFHQPRRLDPDTGEMSESQWILAVVKRFIPPNKYEVEDADEEGVAYTTTMASLIALPDPDAPVSSSSNAFPEYPAGLMVLGMFPDTTVFYRSTIVEGPKRYPAGGGARTVSSAKAERSYKIKFEDDGGQIRIVPAHFVVAFRDG